MQLPNFSRALTELGSNDTERARALGVTAKSIERYRAGKLPKIIKGLMRNPELLLQLAHDAANHQLQDKAA